MWQRCIFHQAEQQERAIRVEVTDGERSRWAFRRVHDAELRERVAVLVERLAELVEIRKRHVRVRVADDRHATAEGTLRTEHDLRRTDRARTEDECFRAVCFCR